MVVRTPVEIKPDEKKQEIERELSNFVKRENEFMARERQSAPHSLAFLYTALEETQRTNSNDTEAAKVGGLFHLWI